MTECHVCGSPRYEGHLLTLTRDLSRSKGMPVGTYTQKILYCVDNSKCAEGAVKYPVPESLERGRR